MRNILGSTVSSYSAKQIYSSSAWFSSCLGAILVSFPKWTTLLNILSNEHFRRLSDRSVENIFAEMREWAVQIDVILGILLAKFQFRWDSSEILLSQDIDRRRWSATIWLCQAMFSYHPVWKNVWIMILKVCVTSFRSNW